MNRATQPSSIILLPIPAPQWQKPTELVDGTACAARRTSAHPFKLRRVYAREDKKVELVYSIDPMDAYFAPYYRFYVELDRSPAVGFKCYGEFDVPAVNSKYISN